MSEYRRVLIPVDLSQGSQLMAPAVRRIIDTSDAEITLLHVVESQPWVGRAGHTLRLMTELEILANRKFRGARLSRRIEWGRPADCILNVLRTDSMDVVLMMPLADSRRNDPLGAVVSQVITESPCPVLLEWPVMHPVNQARVQPVCCAIERDGNEERVLLEAAWAAERCAAPLVLVNPIGLQDPRVREREVAAARSWLEELRDSYSQNAVVQVAAGYPAPVIARALRFHGAGLLVAGGSRDALLAAEGECPVLYTGRARSRQSTRPESRRPYAMAFGRTA
jgi:nucleotide-binding universal stress UspA family protein